VKVLENCINRPDDRPTCQNREGAQHPCKGDCRYGGGE